MRERKKIRDLVATLLKDNGVKEVPVDVEGIAKSLGIEIRKSPTEDDISGFLLRQDEGPAVIGVNILHHPNRQRFTIGHEIGHFVLRHKNGLYVDRSMVKLRSAASSTGEDPEEVEANRFAAELLMPADFIERDFENAPGMDFLDDRKMMQIAKRYQVSLQAMTRRLIDLGFLSSEARVG